MDPTKPITTDELRNQIAETLASVKAYNLPAVCTGLGLAPGEEDEAHRSKRQYVYKRLLCFKQDDLLRIAADILNEHTDADLAELVTETTVHAEHRITEITRRKVLKALNTLESLFGETDIFGGLNIISSEPLGSDFTEYNFTDSLSKYVHQHYVKNPDLSNYELLIKCDALKCSQTRFIAFLERLLDPVVRMNDDQTGLVKELNKILEADGFKALIVGEKSGHPVYAVRWTTKGVSGTAKNLIFASIRTKPDLYFLDAINNDIGIRNNTDALIYDRFLSDSGLLWTELAEWWQEGESLRELQSAKSSLYHRLLESVETSSSPGEITLFRTYYGEFAKVLGEQLPALVPQVYLHYDFRTMKERGNDPALLRQRMDLLLLLNNNIRIVIEVDGKQHYADGDTASPLKYGRMVAEDRRLRLSGYELYRFGGAEFEDTRQIEGRYKIGPKAKHTAINFFEELFKRQGIG